MRNGLSGSQGGVIWPASKSNLASPAKNSPEFESSMVVSPFTTMSSALSTPSEEKLPAIPEGTRFWISAVMARLLPLGLLRRAELELPVAFGGGDIGLADENAAPVA